VLRRAPRLHLGDLEIAVLEALWRAGSATVKELHRALRGEGGPSHNTVQASVERLYRKGLLDRRKVSHAYVYAARFDRKSLLEVAVGEILGRLAGDQRDPTLSAFVDLAAREGEESLRRLEALVAERLGARRDEGEEGDP